METIRRAKICVELPIYNHYEKHFVGTEDEIYAEAHDWAESIALEYIHENNVVDEREQLLIINGTTHTIVWEEDPMSYRCFAVVQDICLNDSVYGIYPSLADAEEAIFTECEDWVYKVLMTNDPMDVMGRDSWDYQEDWKYLMFDVVRDFRIQEVKAYFGGTKWMA